MGAIRVLMQQLIDYAGLFPPANLDMQSAVDNYARYRSSEYGWAIGRLIVPVARLDELAAAVQFLPASSPDPQPWRLSALAGSDLDADLDAIHAFNQRSNRQPIAITIDTIELKASQPDAIRSILRRLPDTLTSYIEIPIDDDPAALLQTIGEFGGRAKVRTGGTRQELFPPPEDLLRFISGCVTTRVPFKATAGLHHPLRARYPLSYEQNSALGTMYGFLNVFLSAAFLAAGINTDAAMQILIEESSAAFRFDEKTISWREQPLDAASLEETRQRIAIAYGSCSFQEPIDDLKAMQLV
jgi:hypothetical protein